MARHTRPTARRFNRFTTRLTSWPLRHFYNHRVFRGYKNWHLPNFDNNQIIYDRYSMFSFFWYLSNKLVMCYSYGSTNNVDVSFDTIIKTTKQKNNSLSLLSCDFTFLFFWGLTYIYIYTYINYWNNIGVLFQLFVSNTCRHMYNHMYIPTTCHAVWRERYVKKS